MTIKEFTSQILSDLKLTSGDNLINDRLVYNEAKSILLMLIRRETDRRRLWSSPNFFTYIPCIEMTQASLAECCEYTSDVKVSKSKHVMPKFLDSNFGMLIQMVTSADSGVKFSEVTPNRYANIIKLGLKKKQSFYWFKNGYIYTNLPDLKVLDIYAYPEDMLPDYLLEPDCDCNYPTSNGTKCGPIYDREFKCPGYLLDNVKTMTLDRISKTYLQLKEDKTTDNVEGT